MTFQKTWVGECSAWECDDLGHLNMRFYMTKTRQARQMFIIKLGLDEAFKPDTVSSIRVRDFHIKYLGEARPGNPLFIETGLLELGDDTAQLCHVMYHADGRLACTVVETIEHFSLLTRVKFNWPKRFVKLGGEIIADQPLPSKPRNIDMDAKSSALSEQELNALGVKLYGMGVFQPYETGLDGFVTPHHFLGRTTETVATITEGWPEMTDQAFIDAGKSGALLEARCFLNHGAEAGDGYHFYSGVHSANAYTRRIIHNIVNPVTGQNLFAMDAVGCLFDLKARKLIKATEAQIAELESNAVKGLAV